MSQPEAKIETPSSAESPPEYRGDEVNAGLVAIVGLFAAVVLLLIVVLVQAWYFTWKGEVTAEQATLADAPGTPLRTMLDEQETQLNTYRWVDREKQVRGIPIERAMEIVAQELKQGKEEGHGKQK